MILLLFQITDMETSTLCHKAQTWATRSENFRKLVQGGGYKTNHFSESYRSHSRIKIFRVISLIATHVSGLITVPLYQYLRV